VPDSNVNPPPAARYTITLSGSEWSVAKYGTVEYLRTHQWARVLVAISGVACVIAGVLNIAGIRWNGNGTFSVWYLYWFAAPTLLWLATVSGSAFQLVFPEAKAMEERKTAEKKFEETKTPEDALNLDFSRLNEYYTINQTQARSSFRGAIFSMFVGMSTIVAGIWIFYFRAAQPDKLMAGLSVAAGLVADLISGLFLLLYSKTQERSLHYYAQLARLKRVSLAMRLVSEHDDPIQKTEARNLVIRQLLEDGPNQTTIDLPAPKRVG
jgi:hypothetical protein